MPASEGGTDICFTQEMTMNPGFALLTFLMLLIPTGHAPAGEEDFVYGTRMPFIQGDDVSVSFAEKGPALLPA